MITRHLAAARGHTQIAWLDSRHSFSFGEYYDPRNMSFGPLRVINEDIIAPASGFGRHGHRDMEIITWVLDGALTHRDSLGNGGIIRPGDVQLMHAGRGIEHSEMNESAEDSVKLLQMWLLPDRAGIEPGYAQQHFSDVELRNRLRMVVGRDDEKALPIQQDASLSIARLDAGAEVARDLAAGRLAWLQVARGAVTLNGQRFEAGDGAGIAEEDRLTVTADDEAEILLYDLPRY